MGSANPAAGLVAACAGVLLASLAALHPCPLCGRGPSGASASCAACRAEIAAHALAARGRAPERLALHPRAGAGRGAAPDPPPTEALWLGPHRGILRRAVHALKYRGNARLASWLGAELALAIGARGWHLDLVTAVPLHRRRRSSRGYDQAELLARAIARRLGLPYRRLLRRTRPTASQARLGRGARMPNVAGAFGLARGGRAAPGARVLLVDDVLTTGATARACAAALLELRVSSVRVAVVARA